MNAEAFSFELKFKVPAGTSRGVLKNKKTYFLILEDEGNVGIGECAVFAGLSYDDRPEYETILYQSIEEWKEGSLDLGAYQQWPSIVMGWEIALRDLASENAGHIFQSPFLEGEPIEINGLIWMGDPVFMLKQMKDKVEAGFCCIKLKIGALDFASELELLKTIRSQFSEDSVEIRVDANGAFAPEDAMKKLESISKFNLHSIEQPIAPGQSSHMAEICKNSPIDIALDEELIGLMHREDRANLLKDIRPQYLILKPSLLGGFASCDEWISLAQELSIEWWATSALESNIGLNAIAQWTSSKNTRLPQGLGTGSLFTNNITAPLIIEQGWLRYNPEGVWDLSVLEE